MKRVKLISYWAVLTLLILTACLILSIGQANARYVDTKVWNTLISPGDGSQTTGILTSRDDELRYPLEQTPSELSFELLSVDENDTVYFSRTDAPVQTEQTQDTLTLRLGEELPPAGTYRLTLTWADGETERIIFFINYSDADASGGAV